MAVEELQKDGIALVCCGPDHGAGQPRTGGLTQTRGLGLLLKALTNENQGRLRCLQFQLHSGRPVIGPMQLLLQIHNLRVQLLLHLLELGPKGLQFGRPCLEGLIVETELLHLGRSLTLQAPGTRCVQAPGAEESPQVAVLPLSGLLHCQLCGRPAFLGRGRSFRQLCLMPLVIFEVRRLASVGHRVHLDPLPKFWQWLGEVRQRGELLCGDLCVQREENVVQHSLAQCLRLWDLDGKPGQQLLQRKA
mmetsp:Transcript_142942/g.249401  ORF Transcript_142942/g.249401 Transcript_142942/m.249401 type:complete len:248 (-) Transcript_142942:229-972(-)